ncbi:unnamed protein product [Effrenium voratum]|nr:unnamed protein product [Effrenium voratum]
MRRALGLAAVVCGEAFWEPRHADFFKLSADISQVERVREVSPEEFDERVRWGKPFIIEDAGRGLDLVGASCESFHHRFPGAKMRAEYTGTRKEKFVSLGGKAWFQKDRPRPEKQRKEMPPDLAQTTAPYVWHVKDGGHEAPPEVRAAVQRAWQPPYFLRGQVNLREANESAEFWFHRRNGAVLAHADTYCIPAVSLQLTGKKLWRLMPHPEVHLSRLAPDSHDGGIYRSKWEPLWEATVQEGEAIVFFPNLFHETQVPSENPECTVATTFQFQLPIPARYLRAYLPTFAMSHLYYEGHCLDLWHSYATLASPEDVQPTTDEQAISRASARLFASVDTDGDARITLEELKGYLSAFTERLPAGRNFGPWPRWFFTEDYFYDWRPVEEEARQMQLELLQGRAEDTLAYLDCCPRDGAVTSAELHAALRQWHLVHSRLHATERLRQRGAPHRKVEELEREFLEKYFARDEL